MSKTRDILHHLISAVDDETHALNRPNEIELIIGKAEVAIEALIEQHGRNALNQAIVPRDFTKEVKEYHDRVMAALSTKGPGAVQLKRKDR